MRKATAKAAKTTRTKTAGKPRVRVAARAAPEAAPPPAGLDRMTATTVRLDQLYMADENVRTLGRTDDLDGLAASIRAHGLIDPLIVRDMGDDRYEAFAALAEEGAGEGDIAARFGLPKIEVRRSLALGRLDAEVREAWGKGVIDADQAKAFAVSDDPLAQRKVLRQITGKRAAPYERRPDAIKRALAPVMRSTDDRRLVFVGEAAYVAAGGRIGEDLFEESRFVLDVDVLDRVADDKLEFEAHALIAAEGWGFVIPRLDQWCLAASGYRLVDPPPFLTEAARAAWVKADAPGRDILMADLMLGLEDEPEKKAGYGAFVTIGSGGELAVTRFIERIEEREAVADDGEGLPTAEPPPEPPAAPPEQPFRGQAALDQSVSETATFVLAEALRRACAADAHLAIAIAIAALDEHAGFGVRMSTAGFKGLRDDAAYGAFQEAVPRLRALDGEALGAAFADRLARAVDVTAGTGFRNDGPLIAGVLPREHIDAALAAIWDPAAYFARLPAAQLDAFMEANGRKPSKGAKSDKVDAAALLAAETRWLPPALAGIRDSSGLSGGLPPFELHETPEPPEAPEGEPVEDAA